MAKGTGKTAEKHDLLPNQRTAPMTTPKSGPDTAGFDSAGTKRNGSTKYIDYPGEPTAPEAYKGGTCK
jgi:hypothetical protein